MKAKLRYVTKNYPTKIAQYEHQEQLLGDRNSYSKADQEAHLYADERGSHEKWTA